MPQDPSALRKNIYFCPSCNQYLPSTEFALSSNSRTVGKCQKCSKMDNDARTRQDYSTYTYMLKMLRRSEERYGDGSRIAFLLQVTFSSPKTILYIKFFLQISCNIILCQTILHFHKVLYLVNCCISPSNLPSLYLIDRSRTCVTWWRRSGVARAY